tara:strand:- start:1988 stop:2485 length:498 start_codon:yes stop_codon:yes gene_type:complete
MASTVTASKLVVKLSESIILNGEKQGGSSTVVISSIDEIYKRIVTCPSNSETTIAMFHSSVADGTLSPLDIEDVKYLRVTNLDDSTNITLSLQSDINENDSAADTSASLLIEPGRSFIMGSTNDGIGISSANANLVTDLVDLESLVVFTGSSAIDVEIFVASASS